MGGSRLEVRVAKRARDGKVALHPPAACIDHMAARRLHLSPRRGTAMVSGSRGVSGSGCSSSCRAVAGRRVGEAVAAERTRARSSGRFGLWSEERARALPSWRTWSVTRRRRLGAAAQ